MKGNNNARLATSTIIIQISAPLVLLTGPHESKPPACQGDDPAASSNAGWSVSVHALRTSGCLASLAFATVGPVI